VVLSHQLIVDIERVLTAASVRHFFVGGLAVIAHGYLRLTADIDMAIDPESEACLRGLESLRELGFKPRLPVPLEQFADPGMRRDWRQHRHMEAFTLWLPERVAELDLMLDLPFPFDAAWEAAYWAEISAGTSAPFVSYEGLVHMKQVAGRSKDLADLDALRKIRGDD
jgi:hypothetical protein